MCYVNTQHVLMKPYIYTNEYNENYPQSLKITLQHEANVLAILR